jgi:hypothetical protein
LLFYSQNRTPLCDIQSASVTFQPASWKVDYTFTQTRNFVAAPPRKIPTKPSPPVPSTSKSQRSKRKVVAGQKTNYQNTRKRRKTKGKGKKRAEEEEELALSSSEEQDADTDLAQNTVQQPRRSGRITNLLEGGYRETDEDVGAEALDEEQYIGDEMAHTIGEDVQPDHPTTLSANTTSMPPYENGIDRMEVDGLQVQDAPPSTLEIEIEEEEKPKPMLQLKYQGFNIYGHCLCIVVEPWPPIRSMSRAPSIFAATPHSRAPSTAPLVSESNFRARTPLFLPDDTDRERSETPAPFQGRKILPPVPSFHVADFAGDSDDSDEGGMMEFSQVLNKAGDFRAGAADDDEDMDGAGAVFFGDADEAREF